MLSINLIKQAIVEANETEFSVPQGESRLYEEYNYSYTLKYGRNFTKAWYGHLYDTVINEIISKYADKSDERRALTVIINSCGTNCDRKKIFSFCQKLSESESIELLTTVNELTINIKKVIKYHCLHFDKTTSDEHEFFARKVLMNIVNSLRSSEDDNRMHLFHLDDLRDDGENVYRKLAAISLIALIPNDINEHMEDVRKFANAFHTQFATKETATSDVKNNPSQKIDKTGIWKAGKTWFEQTKAAGNRFSKLILNNKLLPLVGDYPIIVHTGDTDNQTLVSAINSNTDNLYLIGEGGIGKTTALYSIMRSAYEENEEAQSINQIPLYIELSRANGSTDFSGGSSKFIFNTVLRTITNSLGPIDDLENQLLKLLSDCEGDNPEFVILLDGLNEVSREEFEGDTIVNMVAREIRNIIKNYKNVRIIITSRSTETLLEGKSTRLYFNGISSETIKEHLLSNGYSTSRIEKVTKNEQLMELLRVPLFLTLYTGIKCNSELLTRGEILHAFFAQKRGELYTERNHAETIRDELEDNNTRISGLLPSMVCFMLDFILPAIAWHMAEKGEYQFSQEEIKPLVKQIMVDVSVTAFCGENGKKCFSEYRYSSRENIRTVAKEIISYLNTGNDDKWSNITSGVCECLDKQLGVIVTNDYDVFEMVHEHIRDYFAALYHINKLRLASYLNDIANDSVSARESLKDCFEEPLPNQVLTFIGEALGEAHNSPQYDDCKKEWMYLVPDPKKERCERNLISRSIDIFRGEINENNYMVWNLFQILKLSRHDLSGENFSFLDLSKCRANGYRLGNKTFASKIEGSLLSDNFFMPYGHTSGLTSADFSPDGKYIVTTSHDNTAMIWEFGTFEVIRTLTGHKHPVLSAQYSPKGDSIVTSSVDGTIIWDAKTYEILGTLDGTLNVYSAEFSPDGNYIVTASADCTAKIWDSKSFKEIATLSGHKAFVRSAHYSPDGKQILTRSNDCTIIIWNAVTFERLATLHDHYAALSDASYSTDSKYIIASSSDCTAKIWDAKTFEEITKLDYRIYDDGSADADSDLVKFSPDGKYILITSAYVGRIRVFDRITHEESFCIYGHKSILNSLNFSKDGKYFITASEDHSAKIWSSQTFGVVGNLIGHSYGYNAVQCSADGNRIAIASSDGKAVIWDVGNLKVVGTFQGHSDEIRSIQYSPDGKFLLTASSDRTAKVWDSKSFEDIGTLYSSKWGFRTAQYSPDGNRIITTTTEHFATIWDAHSFTKVKELYGHDDFVCYAQYSPQGDKILSVSADGNIIFWDANTFDIIGTIEHPRRIYYSVQFSPDGNFVVVATRDKDATIWNAQTFEVVGTLEGHELQIFSAQYSSDGKYIVTASDDKTVKVWNAKTFKEEYTLAWHTDAVTSAQFDPDGYYVVSSSRDNSVIVWNIDRHEPAYEIRLTSGLDIENLDIRKINPESHLSDDMMSQLRDHGAIWD